MFKHCLLVGYFYLLSCDFFLNKLCEVVSGKVGPNFLCGLLLNLGSLVTGVLDRIVLFLFVPQADVSFFLDEGVASLSEPLHFLNFSSELGGLFDSSCLLFLSLFFIFNPQVVVVSTRIESDGRLLFLQLLKVPAFGNCVLDQVF